MVRSPDFFSQGYLAVDAVQGVGAGETVSFFETGNLGRSVCCDDDGFVDAFVDAGFEEQRHIVQHHGMRVLLCCLLRQPGLLAGDAGMDDGFQRQAFRWMAKDDGSEHVAIEAAVGIEDGLAERVDDGSPSRFAGLDDLPRQQVGIDYDRAALLEHLGDGAFAGRDAACEADHNHGGGA